jgi:NAD(P)-dependent dehydrogenase (short-subunit alcohol dehydrogenase family)
MKRRPTLALLLQPLLLALYACGWTTPTTPSRRGFLAGGATVAAGGLATIVTTGASFPAVATAATKQKPTASSLVEPGSLTGQVMVITGGSTGLGLESAKDLAQGGATVVLTARTDQKGQAAVETIQTALSAKGITNPNVFYVTLDLDRLDNIATFRDRFNKVLPLPATKIDVLMNNAGVMAIPERQLTVDGYERTFQSNHLGHFVLTAQLFPYLNDRARIIHVSSLAYQFTGGKPLDINNLNSELSYGPWQSYGYSKLENILFAQELQRRADAAGRTGLISVALHPGAVNTDLIRNFIGEKKWDEKKKQNGATNNAWEKFLDSAISSALLTIDEGAATQVYLASATADDNDKAPLLVKGAFYNLQPEKLPDFATNELAARQLWEVSERLGHIKFDILPVAATTKTTAGR